MSDQADEATPLIDRILGPAPSSTDDQLWSGLQHPIWILTNALLGIISTALSGWALRPDTAYVRDWIAICTGLRTFFFGPLAEASIRKRDFEAAQTTGVWAVLKRVRKGKLDRNGNEDGEREKRRTLRRRAHWCAMMMYAVVCLPLPMDNIWGVLVFPYRYWTNATPPNGWYILSFDIFTTLKRSSSFVAFTLTCMSIHRPNPTFDRAISILIVVSLISGRLATFFAELQKPNHTFRQAVEAEARE